MLSQIENDIFKYLNLKLNQDYYLQNVFINQEEYIYTVYIPSKTQHNIKQNYYLTHGFEGSSLFFFDLVLELKQYGDIVLFDLRGMGFSSKNNHQIHDVEDIIEFYLQPIQMVCSHFKHRNITMIGHSFGAYLVILLSSYFSNIIERVIAFSPIGITPADQDYYSKGNNCSHCMSRLMYTFGWKFKVTYKLLLRYCGCCCRTRLIRNRMKSYGNSEARIMLFTKLIMLLYQEKQGSINFFFQLFEPGVLPKYCLLQHFIDQKPKLKTLLVYGQHDWVDIKGAQDLKNLYPNNFELMVLRDRSHQMFFEGKEGQQSQLINIITMR